MKLNKRNLAAAASIVAALAQPAASAEEMVEGYVTSSDGSLVTSGSGECVRTIPKESSEYLKECGYDLVVEKAAAVASDAAVGTAVTVAKSASIVKDNKVVASSGVVVEQVVIHNVQFDFDSDVLTPDYKAALDAASEFLKPHRPLLRQGVAQLNVVGYTDSVGDATYNQMLSERRARSVANYLMEQDPTREAFIYVIGRGETDPVAGNDTEEGRLRNRRVALEIIGK